MGNSPKRGDGHDLILGAGMTGLSAGWTSKLPVFEAGELPGGICASYYIGLNGRKYLRYLGNNDAYRFEIGGGHWTFGASNKVLKFIHKFAATKNYIRKSSVYFAKKDLFIPYPLQNNLRLLDKSVAKDAFYQISHKSKNKASTMKEWLENHFGRTLCELFFWPFHNLYTAGLYAKIAPQDMYKSPLNRSLTKQGLYKTSFPVGYNATFIYPVYGLNRLAQRIAQECNMHYAKRAVRIDTKAREVHFTDKDIVRYKTIISTLPLNQTIGMTGLTMNAAADPYTSILVLNIGAMKGRNCPTDHWLYINDSNSGFHRIGFYSNVDSSFLPKSSQGLNNRVGIYVERAFMGGQKPSLGHIKDYSRSAIKELREWKFIKDIDVMDASWIEVAYTWSYPSSLWKEEAIGLLNKNGIFQLGRYGKWKFQGIADSINDGLECQKI